MANKFWVDWSDPPFPRIRPASEATDLLTELVSLTQCKKEIIIRAREEREHWLSIIKQTKELTDTQIYQGKN